MMWQRPGDWSFARAIRSVPVLATEASAMATAFPLLFARQEGAQAGTLELVALLRLGDGGTSPFVGADGRWRAAQIPPLLQLYPFSLAPVAGGRFGLVVDESSGLLSHEPGHGDALFLEDGVPGPELARVIAQFEQRAAAAGITSRAIAALEAEGLLTQWHPPGHEATEEASQEKLFTVDPAKLQALSGDAMARLHSAHAAGLAYVQIVSMHHIPWLQKAMAVNNSKPARTTPAAFGVNDATTAPADAFLTALSTAQFDEMQDVAGQFLMELPAEETQQETC